MDQELFFGPWHLEVVAKVAYFAQRFVVTGSDNADGAYPGVVGQSVDVVGDRWVVTMDWQDQGPFEPSRIARSATYDVEGGLVVTLGADDGPEATADRDFDDVILTCRSTDPALDPNHPSGNPYDFSIPEDMLVRRNEKPDRRDRHPTDRHR